MSKQAKHLYEFGPFRLDAAERLLRRDGEPVPLTPKAFDTLLALVESSGHIVEKDELLRRVWPGATVEEATLAQNIRAARKALGENPAEPQYIETVPKHGYRFVAAVREVRGAGAALVVERHTRARVVTEEEEESNAQARAKESGEGKNRRARWTASPILPAMVVLLAGLVALSYFWLWRTQGAKTAAVKSIAVLPFKPLVADSRDESVELGMAETLINKLSGIRQITVRPISAVRKYSALDQDPVAAGRELGVDAVLDGSIQWNSAGKIRVTTRLIRISDGSALWADMCDEQCRNIFEAQDAIAEKMASALALTLTGEARKLLAKRYTDNQEAYRLYLLGRFHLSKRGVPQARKSIEHFEQAIKLDPTYAIAYTGLADAYDSLNGLGGLPPKDSMPKAKAAIMRALEIDDLLSEAHASLALYFYNYDWDWAGAEKEFQRTLELNPNLAEARRGYALLLVDAGRFDEALAQSRQAVELEPTSALINREVGQVLYLARQYDQAISQLQKTVDLDPNFMTGYFFLARAYEARGLYEQAIEADLKSKIAEGASPGWVAALQAAHRASGWQGYWRTRLVSLQEQARRGYVGSYDFVEVYARLGERDRVFEWLEKAYEERSYRMPMIKNDPLLDPLRTDPRFADLLRRLNLAPQ